MVEKHNAADPVLVMDEANRDKNMREQELIDIKEIISRPEGLRFFRRVMAEGLVFTTTFTGNSRGMFLEGHRNLALKFLNDVVEAAPNKIAELMVSGKEEREVG